MDEDVTSIWDAGTSGGGTGARELANVVNQHLVAITSDGSPTPRLLADLPSLERGTWAVQPDGGRETTWRLRPNVLWHDGTPFTAEDVLFSYAVNRDSDIPNANQATVRLLSRMDAVELPLIPLYFRMDAVPVGGGITGPVANTGVAHGGFILHTWNISDWDVHTRG